MNKLDERFHELDGIVHDEVKLKCQQNISFKAQDITLGEGISG